MQIYLNHYKYKQFVTSLQNIEFNHIHCDELFHESGSTLMIQTKVRFRK